MNKPWIALAVAAAALAPALQAQAQDKGDWIVRAHALYLDAANKVKAGANSAITQFFFNPDAYFHFVDEVRALGVTVPIVPGIMPIHSYARIAQFAARDGIEIPRWVALKMEGFMDDAASIRAFGIDVVTELCERLIEGGAPGIHFYTMNQSAATLEICKRLGR